MASMKMLMFLQLNHFTFFFLLLKATAELHRLEHPAKTDGSLSILVVGDWGRKGTYNQTEVAHQVIKITLNLYNKGLVNLTLIIFHNFLGINYMEVGK